MFLLLEITRRGKGKEKSVEDPKGSPASEQATPEGILQLGLGFWGSKTLLSAVEIGLFTELAKGSLTEGLRTGQPQNEAKGGGENFFAAIYADPGRLEGFLNAMTGISLGSAMAIAKKVPWDRYKTFVDVGAAQGGLPVQVALAHEHLTGGGFDLPSIGPIFEEYVASHGLGERLRFYPGDFFENPLPAADVLVMGHILHDWDLLEKRLLLQKAYEAPPEGGALIVYEALIDDERRENTFGLLMSL